MKKSSFKVQKRTGYKPGYPETINGLSTVIKRRKITLFSFLTIGFIFFILFSSCDNIVEMSGDVAINEDYDVVQDVSENPDENFIDSGGVSIPDETQVPDEDMIETGGVAVLDSDGDGIPDEVEGEDDVDGDDLPNSQDTDSDGDGILDKDEAGDDPWNPRDTDEDGTPDYLDTNSDGDGYSDKVEMEAGTDPYDAESYPEEIDGDMVPDYDYDGIDDDEEGEDDIDGDGIPNYKDEDSDGDGISDKEEAGDEPWNPKDTDGDGTPDYKDTDSDGDGYSDEEENEVGSDPYDDGSTPEEIGGAPPPNIL